MTNRALNLAQLIVEAEPDAALGSPEAVERVIQALAKISGALLATTLVRDGEEGLGNAVQRAAQTMDRRRGVPPACCGPSKTTGGHAREAERAGCLSRARRRRFPAHGHQRSQRRVNRGS